MLKIHWPPLQRKATSGISLTWASFTLSTVPRIECSKVMVPVLFPNTTIGSEIGWPLAPHTVNFTGTVLPTFQTLLPSWLIGGRITPPGVPPVQVPKVTLIVTSFDALL